MPVGDVDQRVSVLAVVGADGGVGQVDHVLSRKLLRQVVTGKLFCKLFSLC